MATLHCSSMARSACSVLLLLLLVSTTILAQQSSYFDNIPGDYCRKRGDPCCLKRQDDCSVPLMGTLCYCDEFCDRAINPDCCPDYRHVCLGITTPLPDYTGCVLPNKKYVSPNTTHRDNCNKCDCNELGEASCTALRCLTNTEMLAKIQQANNIGWKAENYSMFWGKELNEGMMFRTGANEIPLESLMHPLYLRYDTRDIPRSFDARDKWPNRVSKPRDQGWCGASWAFSATGVASDRFAIQSKGREVIPISPQTLISCDPLTKQGCGGGGVRRAWQYLRRRGAVDEDCYPYTSGDTGQKGKCHSLRGNNYIQLSNKCDTSAQVRVGRSLLYKMEPPYRIRGTEGDIQYEIMTSGPVQAMMRVQQDFLYYRSGVYSSPGLSDPRDSRAHAVRILGWGEEGYNNKYWLVSNSWGEWWGEGGLFKIARGVNESGIEEHILTVRAVLPTTYPTQYESDPQWGISSFSANTNINNNNINPQWFYQ